MAEVTQIKKRNGDVVEFDSAKIERAMQKAFVAVQGTVDEDVVHEMSSRVASQVESRYADSIPTVENIQNIVEETLMLAGYFAVARAYIIYRYEHSKVREERKQEVIEKLTRNDLYVIKGSGKRERFDLDKVRKTVKNNIDGIESAIEIEELVEQIQQELYDEISTRDVGKSLVMALRSRIERDPAYSKAATRLQNKFLMKEAMGDLLDLNDISKSYKESFARNIKKGVEVGIFDPRLMVFNLHEMAEAIRPERDDLLEYLGLQTLTDRYFAREPKTNGLLETPQMFWMRVAMGLAIAEPNKDEMAKRFYEVISTLRYVPSTPTLFHSGTTRPQLSSCYLTTINDDLGHIFKSIGDNAQLSKFSGGIGNDWSNLRGMGAWIKGIDVESQGVVPFLKVANDVTVAINRSGRRRGATCAYLEVWHWDIEDFLELRRNTGDDRRRTHDMNTAAWVPDLFMKRVEEDSMWTLFSPDEVPDLHHLYGSAFEKKYEQYEQMAEEGTISLSKRMRARDLWKRMLSMLYETGHPWITFKDPSNVRSPQDHVGVIHSSNLCTEIMLNTSPDETAVCNLGSVNLAMHLRDGRIDEEKIAETVKLAKRMLDNVIDINYYPTPEAKFSNMKHRPVGLGIMGLQDALYLMDINFDTEGAVEFSDQVMELISYHAILGSSELAKEKGTYKTYPGSKWDRGLLPIDTIDLLEQERGRKIDVDRKMRLDWTPVRDHIRQFGMRNSNTMAIAPTATIANIAGCNPSIEPIYKNVYVKSNMSGEFTVVNSYLIDDLKKLGIWSAGLLEEIKRQEGDITGIDVIPMPLREKYKETFAIDSEWLIKAAAYRGKWIDQSQSINIFLRTTSGKRLSDVYLHAWNMGLKTTYYLRTLAATSVEQSSVELKGNAPEVTPQPVQEQIVEQPVIETPRPKVKSLIEGLITASHKSEHVESPSLRGGLAPASGGVATMTMPATANVSTATDAATGLKLCAIDDPDCEACQ